MPYLTKKQLYEFEQKAFFSGMNYGYAVDHTQINKCENLMWQHYKNEITTEEWEEKLDNLNGD